MAIGVCGLSKGPLLYSPPSHIGRPRQVDVGGAVQVDWRLMVLWGRPEWNMTGMEALQGKVVEEKFETFQDDTTWCSKLYQTRYQIPRRRNTSHAITSFISCTYAAVVHVRKYVCSGLFVNSLLLRSSSGAACESITCLWPPPRQVSVPDSQSFAHT